MGFGDILDQWDKRSGKKPPSRGEQSDWAQQLDRYLPQEKEADRPQASVPRLSAREERLVRERAKIEDELDLHGCQKAEALNLLQAFLQASVQAGLRKVSVIHGKGLHSQGEAVLKTAVRTALDQSRLVMDWGEGQRREGGSGAVWVWLSVRGK